MFPSTKHIVRITKSLGFYRLLQLRDWLLLRHICIAVPARILISRVAVEKGPVVEKQLSDHPGVNSLAMQLHSLEVHEGGMSFGSKLEVLLVQIQKHRICGRTKGRGMDLCAQSWAADEVVCGAYHKFHLVKLRYTVIRSNKMQ